MNNRPAIDRELLIPILIGGLSVVGIAVVLIVGRSLSAPAEVAATPSSTPFQYIYLGTEPAITTPIVEGSDLPPTEEPITEVPIFDTPVFDTPTRPVATPIILQTRTVTSNVPRTGTPTRASTATRTSPPSVANNYDDTDSRLTYSGSWTSQLEVSGAYQNSLHISYAVGNSVTFTFTGTEIHVFYQAGPSLGTMTITIDSFGDAPISQAQNTTQIKEWVSDQLSSGTHAVVIQHNSGGSINIDRFYIPAPTPTPTRTPTP
ncbi:MAG TPA: hypothetical protein VLE49_21820 [Anaerolineales bacterium]|nr:hypothetical protein [Anaerolineales bacterium]